MASFPRNGQFDFVPLLTCLGKKPRGVQFNFKLPSRRDAYLRKRKVYYLGFFFRLSTPQTEQSSEGENGLIGPVSPSQLTKEKIAA